MANSLNTQWHQFLWDCYHHGKKTTKDDSPILELMGNYVFLERPQDFYGPFYHEVDDSYEYLKYMKKGMYNIPDYPIKDEALYRYVTSWCDKQQIYNADSNLIEALGYDSEKGFVYTYPERVLHIPLMNENHDFCFIDQDKIIMNRLRKNPGTNRAVATLYQAGLDGKRTDIPCLNWLQATIRDNKLELHCMFRSNDLFGAWVSNMYFLTFYGLNLVSNINQIDDANLKFNGIHYHSSSLHIYETDLPEVRRILGERK